MGFDWETYCLQWLSVLCATGLVWPLIGVCIDIFVYGVERQVNPVNGLPSIFAKKDK